MNATHPRLSPAARRAGAIIFSIACMGCHPEMHDQPRYEALEASDFFADGKSARPLITGTVARGELREDTAFFTGRSGEQFVEEIPLPIDRDLLTRGQERFNIYCSVCHAPIGDRCRTPKTLTCQLTRCVPRRLCTTAASPRRAS